MFFAVGGFNHGYQDENHTRFYQPIFSVDQSDTTGTGTDGRDTGSIAVTDCRNHRGRYWGRGYQAYRSLRNGVRTGAGIYGVADRLILLLAFHVMKMVIKGNREKGKEQAYPLVPFLSAGMLLLIV